MRANLIESQQYIERPVYSSEKDLISKKIRMVLIQEFLEKSAKIETKK